MDKIFRIPEFKIYFSGQGRRQTEGDTTYAIYPVVMLVEGIHHGAIGDPVYYSAAVLEASVNEWNGVPVPIHHPQNSNGDYVLCDTPDIINEWSVGVIRNARWDGKLKAEVYIDIVQAETKQPGLVSLLDQGNPPMEVSTGLTAFDDGQPGQFNSEDHSASITQIFPDHLALLPGGRGACSQNDGCGIRANQKEASMKKKKPLVLLLADAKAGDKLSLQELLFPNELSHDDVADKLRAHVDSLDVRGTDGFTKYHYVREIYDKFFVYMERTDEGSQLYQQSYNIDADDKLVLGESVIPVKEKTEYIPIEVNNDKEVVMKRGTKANDGQPCCPKKVAGLIANEHSPYTDDDQEFLNSWTDDQLDKALALVNTAVSNVDNSSGDEAAAAAALKANASPDTEDGVTLESYLKDAPVEIRVMMNDALKARDNQKGELVATIMANQLNKFTEPELKAMEVSQLEGIVALVTPEKKAPVYTGQGGGFTEMNTDEEVEPYVPVHLNFGKKTTPEVDN